MLSGCGQALVDPNAVASPAGNSLVPSAAPDISADGGQPGGAVTSPAAQASAAPDTESAPPGGVVEPPPSVAAEAAPTPAPPAEAPTIDPAFAGVQLPPAAERWRYMQMDREVFEPIRNYATSGPETLWWYDPVFGQTVALGEINGDFPVQAAFRLRGQEFGALEVPYQINASFGLRIPDALQARMRNAGAGEWVETFVYAKSDVQPR